MPADQGRNESASDDEMDVDALVAHGQELVDAILRRRPASEIKALIAAGAPVWFQDDEGTSPLHAAAYVENEELVRFLIDEGAVWNAGEHDIFWVVFRAQKTQELMYDIFASVGRYA